MNGYEHPGTILLIHQEMVNRELMHGRRDRIGRDDVPRPGDRNGAGRIRIAISNGLFALARRIAPAEPANTGLPAGARH